MVDYPWTPPIGGSKLCGPQNLNCQIQIDWKSEAQNSGHKKHFDVPAFCRPFLSRKKKAPIFETLNLCGVGFGWGVL